MPIIIERARQIDRTALTFAMMGNGGGEFKDAVLNVIDENPQSIKANGLEISEVAELATVQDDMLFNRLINNNANCRCTSTLSVIKPAALAALTYTLLPFDVVNFCGGGLEIHYINNQANWFTSNKCGVYRVSFGLSFSGIGGGVIINPKIAIFKIANNGSYQNIYLTDIWEGYGTLTAFWAGGSDLVELEEGESIDLRIYSGNAAPLLSVSYQYYGWIAINYTGNQH